MRFINEAGEIIDDDEYHQAFPIMDDTLPIEILREMAVSYYAMLNGQMDVKRFLEV
jgi:hypothetical protein